MGALTGKTYTSTFGLLGFFYAGSGNRTIKRPGRQAVYQADQLPYGNNRTIQQSGWSPKPFTQQIVIKGADEAAWANAINTHATLTLLGDSPRAAYLSDVGEFEIYPDHLDALTVSVTFEF